MYLLIIYKKKYVSKLLWNELSKKKSYTETTDIDLKNRILIALI